MGGDRGEVIDVFGEGGGFSKGSREAALVTLLGSEGHGWRDWMDEGLRNAYRDGLGHRLELSLPSPTHGPYGTIFSYSYLPGCRPR